MLNFQFEEIETVSSFQNIDSDRGENLNQFRL